VLERHPAAACIAFQAEPQAVLGAVLAGGALPGVEARQHPVLVAPGVPGLWRPATPEEARAFEACGATASRDVTDAVRALLEAGALRLCGPGHTPYEPPWP
jgi:hypothetical protein